VSFRAKLLLAFSAATLVSLSLLAVGVRQQISRRLAAQHQRRVDALARVAVEDLSRENSAISARLASLASSLADNNTFRLAVRGAPDERRFLLDWAGDAMRTTGLSMLQVQDASGRILSSGHFRNEFDRLAPQLPLLLAPARDSITVVAMRAPEGSFLALARERSLDIGDRRFTLIGGITIDRAFLGRFARDGDVSVSLVTPEGSISSDSIPSTDASVSTEKRIAYIDARAVTPDDLLRVAPARLVVAHASGELDALRRDVNRLFAFAIAAAALAGLGLAAWMSGALSRPLAALAQATSTIALEGEGSELEIATGRDDEIGTLARRFGVMGRRLRASAVQLRDAERRATVGEMARQVNHDIKNGLIPIRNVVQHFAETQEREPERLPAVFGERRATLEASIGYLDTLARNYARLTPRTERRAFDAGAVASEAVRSASAGGTTVLAKIAGALPPVVGDPVILRRILDNLLRNAIESLSPGDGRVTLETLRSPVGGVRVIVADTGRGMSEQELSHAFDDFHTTKPAGTGLGLSVVRRLTADLQADLRVESAPGRGTTFTIDFPAP
jgi:signal transduction histidine kinase